MIPGVEEHVKKVVETVESEWKEMPETSEVPKNMEDEHKLEVEQPDISFIERTSRTSLIEQCSMKAFETNKPERTDNSEGTDTKKEGLTEEEKTKIKEETGWSDEIIESIKNMKQYEVLKNAGLIEVEIDGRKCLIKENIDLGFTDEDGVSNRERIVRGLAPLDSKTGKPMELHHLGQKADSPLVELSEEEHRTGEYEDGKKNQSLWHDNTVETEVHGDGNNWDQERKAHWKERAGQA